MRNSDCYRISKLLLPYLPEFVTNKKSEIFIAPIENVWRGFAFEGTPGPREDFYFWWFFMPICRPVDHLTLSNGGRLKVPNGDVGWRSDLVDLPEKMFTAMESVLPFLRALNSHQDTIEALYNYRGGLMPGMGAQKQVSDIHVQSDIACLQILAGEFEKAELMLDLVIAHELGADRRQWVLDIVKRTKMLRAKLLVDPDLAVNQVKEWQDITFRMLKLEKWRHLKP